MSNVDDLRKQIDEVFDASPNAASDPPASESPGNVDESFWQKTIVVEFTNTMYLPNEYTIDSELHDLEVLAFAYENNDQFARASLSSEDALCVWGWIVKKRTGRYPNTFELIDKKAKRLRRREMGPSADTFIDCRVTPIPARPRSNSANSNTRSGYAAHNKKKAAAKSGCAAGALCTGPCNDARWCNVQMCGASGRKTPTLGFCFEGSSFCPPKC